MTVLVYLIPIALILGLAALIAFLWALKSGQFEDMDGAASRILFEDDDALPKPGSATSQTTAETSDGRQGNGSANDGGGNSDGSSAPKPKA